MKLIVAPNYAGICEKAADIFAAEIHRNPACVLGLATGSTPVGLYQALIHRYQEGALDFSKVQTFNLDEYCGLAGDHPQSYRYFMQKNLFDHVNIPPEHTHIPSGIAVDPEQECRRYDALIESCGGIDIQLLGIGHNGHIGFNEPISSLASRTRAKALTPATYAQNSVYFNPPESMPKRAFTMGVGTILDAARVVMLITGAKKAGIAAKAIEGPVTSMVTGSALQMHPNAVVILDEAAASQLTQTDYYNWVFANEPEWEPYR